MTDGRLHGRRALVTGASRGIGRAIAQAFAEQGATVAVGFHSNHEAAEEAIGSLPGGGHMLAQADIATPEGARSLIANTVKRLGGIDILVNNAGIFRDHRIADVDFDAWHDAWTTTLAANLIGPAHTCYAAAQHMIRQGSGRIINVSSRGAFRGEPEAPAYGASKAGLNAMSQSLAVALAPHGIFVGVVAPGFVETDMAASSLVGEKGDAIRQQSPLGRVARPDEVANAVLFLAGEGVDFATGAILDVNGASYLRS